MSMSRAESNPEGLSFPFIHSDGQVVEHQVKIDSSLFSPHNFCDLKKSKNLEEVVLRTLDVLEEGDALGRKSGELEAKVRLFLHKASEDPEMRPLFAFGAQMAESSHSFLHSRPSVRDLYQVEIPTEKPGKIGYAKLSAEVPEEIILGFKRHKTGDESPRVQSSLFLQRLRKDWSDGKAPPLSEDQISEDQIMALIINSVQMDLRTEQSLQKHLNSEKKESKEKNSLPSEIWNEIHELLGEQHTYPPVVPETRVTFARQPEASSLSHHLGHQREGRLYALLDKVVSQGYTEGSYPITQPSGDLEATWVPAYHEGNHALFLEGVIDLLGCVAQEVKKPSIFQDYTRGERQHFVEFFQSFCGELKEVLKKDKKLMRGFNSCFNVKHSEDLKRFIENGLSSSEQTSILQCDGWIDDLHNQISSLLRGSNAPKAEVLFQKLGEALNRFTDLMGKRPLEHPDDGRALLAQEWNTELSKLRAENLDWSDMKAETIPQVVDQYVQSIQLVALESLKQQARAMGRAELLRLAQQAQEGYRGGSVTLSFSMPSIAQGSTEEIIQSDHLGIRNTLLDWLQGHVGAMCLEALPVSPRSSPNDIGGVSCHVTQLSGPVVSSNKPEKAVQEMPSSSMHEDGALLDLPPMEEHSFSKARSFWESRGKTTHS